MEYLDSTDLRGLMGDREGAPGTYGWRYDVRKVLLIRTEARQIQTTYRVDSAR